MKHLREAIKRKGDDMMSPFTMGYQDLPPIDVHGSQGYEDSKPRVSNSEFHGIF
jgi:hypothetical protein